MTRVLFFGSLKEAAGAGQRMIEMPQHALSFDELIERVAAGDARLAAALALPSVRIAVDQSIVGRNLRIGPAKEIAFMPPFSGG